MMKTTRSGQFTMLNNREHLLVPLLVTDSTSDAAIKIIRMRIDTWLLSGTLAMEPAVIITGMPEVESIQEII